MASMTILGATIFPPPPNPPPPSPPPTPYPPPNQPSSQMDSAILVCSGADSPVSQTKEHILLAKQVGVPNVVLFLNKQDKVDDEEFFELVNLEVRELHSSYKFSGDDVSIVTGSALLALEALLMNVVDSYIPIPQSQTDLPITGK